jgi:hypothetical protein
MRAAADRGGDDEHDLVRPRPVGHAELDGVEMAAHIGRGHMMQRDVDARAGGRHLHGRRHDRLGAAHGMADAEAAGLVPQGCMFQLAVQPDDGALAIGLQLGTLGVQDLHHAPGELDREWLQCLHHRLDVGFVATGIGVGDDAAHHRLGHRPCQRRPEVVESLLDRGHIFPHLHQIAHPASDRASGVPLVCSLQCP